MTAPRNTARGIVLMSLAALAFAVMSALIKLAAARLPSFQIVFFRGALGLAGLAAWERLTRIPIRRAVDRRRLFLRSLFGFGGIATYVWAIAHVGLGVASALNQSSPVFVALFSLVLLRERPPAFVTALVLVALVGAWLVISPDLGGIDVDATIGLASAVLAALAYVTIRELARTDHPIVIVRWFVGWSAALAVPFLVAGMVWPELVEAAGCGWVAPTPVEWLAVAGVAAFGLAGQILMTDAYRHERASVVAPFMYLSVVVSLLLDLAFWGTLPPAWALVGSALVVGSSVGIAWGSQRR